MRDLESRLREGPLRVQSVWVADRPASVARRALRRRRAVALGGALALVAASAALALVIAPRARAPVHGATAQPAQSFAPEPLRFSDGSRAEPHGIETQLRIEESTPARVRVRLTGGARFEVTPNPARAFEVVAGDVLVRVLGTAFSVDPTAQRTRVSVEHGRVQVSWASGSAVLIAGEVGTFPPLPVSAVLEPVASDAAPQLERKAGDTVQPGPQTAEDLMLAADVARLGAHPEAALAPLRRLIARYPKDKRAPVAAFTLGRVLLDDLGRADEAASAFESAHRAWPSGPLAQDALVRAVQAWQAAGQPQRARSAAQLYLRRFPDGAHAAAMRQATGEAR